MRSLSLGTADSRRTKQEQSQTCLNFALQGGGRRSQSPCPMLYWAWLFVVEGINDGVVKEVRHLPSPFRATFRLNENRTKLVCVMSSVRKVG